MHTLEITIQRRLGNIWPVVVEYTLPGSSLQQRAEGKLALDLDQMNAVSREDYGETLGKALFKEEIAMALKRAQPADNELLHVLLFVEADELKPLRWERLCVPVDNHNWFPVALQQQLPFSLYLPTTIDRQFPPFGRRDLKALVVVSNPSNLAEYNLLRFDAAGAVEGVRAALGESIASDVLGPVAGAGGPASLDVLCERITALPYTILHVVAHGSHIAEMNEPLLYLSNADNTTASTKASVLVNRLTNLRKLPHLAFLCCCELAAPEAEGALGGLAQRLVRDLGMPAVIAMTDRISVATATDLSTAFYRRLREHGEVDRALSQSYAGLASRPDVAVPVPVLFTRLGRRTLFSDTLDRELTPAEIAEGLARLRDLLPERSPILLPKFEQWAAVVHDTNAIDLKELGAEVLRDRERAMAAINEMCGEVVDLSFKAFAIGMAALPYDVRCPFAGLYPFTCENREFFFGREPLIEQLYRRLEDAPFLAVLGSSGSGKSSLVLAGLLPRLCPGPDCPGTAVMTPGDDPTARLDAALAAAGAAPVVLVVDQLEELFTLCTNEMQRKTFLGRLFELWQKMKIVLTMRADFLGECAPYQQLREMMQAHQELVPPMNEEELRRAMESQAGAVKLRFEANLANQILDDVRQEPGAMPLLQHALRELWKRRHGRWLKADEYADEDKLGGVRLAISRTADALYADATPTERERMRFVFERLARIDTDTPEPEKRRDTRRRETLDGLTPDGGDPVLTRQLVTKLANAKLVVTSRAPDTNQVEVEVAHEALIRYWVRLRQWLDEARNTERLVASVRDGAAAYAQRTGRSKFSLRGRDLAEAVKVTRAMPPRLSQSEVKFVNACRFYEWAINWSLLAITVVFGIVALAAVWQWSRAVSEHQTQQALHLAAQSQAERENRPQYGALLAIAAAKIRPEERSVIQSLRDAATFCCGRPLEGHEGGIDSLALCPGKPWLATGGKADRTVILWKLLDDGSAPKKLSELVLKDTGAQVHTIAFSGKGEWLAVVVDDVVFLWDLRNGIPTVGTEHRLGGSNRRVSLIAFPNEQCFVTVENDGKTGSNDVLQLYSLAQKDFARQGQVLSGTTGTINQKALVASLDGRWLFAGGSDLVVWRWDLQHPHEAAVPLYRHDKQVNAIAISPDGNWVASGGDDRRVIVARLDNRVVLAGRQAAGLIGAPATGTWHSLFGVHPLITGQGREFDFLEHEHRVFALAFTHKARSGEKPWLVSGSEDKTARLWDLNEISQGRLNHSSRILIGHDSWVNRLAITRDNEWLVTGSLDKTARCWNLHSGMELFVLRGQENTPRGLAVSIDQDKGWAAVISEDGSARVWDLRTENPPRADHTLFGHTDTIFAAAIDPATGWAVTGGADETARLWNLNAASVTQGGQPLHPTHKDWVTAAAISSKWIVTASANGKAIYWDRGTSADPVTRPGVELDHHKDGVRALALLENLAVTGSDDGTACIWHLGQKDPRTSPLQLPRADSQDPRPKGWIRAVAISPNRKLVLTGSYDHKAYLWNVSDGSFVRPFEHHTGPVTAVGFVKDDSVVTASEDGTALLWRLGDPGEPIQLIPDKKRVTPRELRGLSISKDGRWLVITGDAPVVWLYDLSARDVVSTVQQLQGDERHRVTGSAFSPDGRWLALSSYRDSFLWDLSSPKIADSRQILTKVVPSEETGGSSWAVAISDEHVLTTSGKLAQRWHLRTNKLIEAAQSGVSDRARSEYEIAR
jgi:WD40 repeat protein